MGYKCMKCKTVIEDFEGKIRCPKCGYRIFTKERPSMVKRVSSD